MDDAAFVGVFEGFADLFGDWQRFGDGDRSGFDTVRKSWAFDQFHDQGVRGAGVFEAIDGGNVGMVEGGEQGSFATEAGQALGIGGDSRRQNFQGDLATEFAVAGAVDFAHAAYAEERIYFVDADFGAGDEGHWLAGEL